MRLGLLKGHRGERFVKFSIVGAVNFLIDFSVLNVLSFVTGIEKGITAALLSAVSFLIANINSYFLNRGWTFKSSSACSNYRMFLAVSVFGVVINISIVYILTTFVEQSYFSGIVWFNISKIIATGFVLFFNYFGYKRYVFKN